MIIIIGLLIYLMAFFWYKFKKLIFFIFYQVEKHILIYQIVLALLSLYLIFKDDLLLLLLLHLIFFISHPFNLIIDLRPFMKHAIHYFYIVILPSHLFHQKILFKENLFLLF